MKILVFGDVVGEVGRAAISQVLPSLRQEYQPDAVIINIENSAHGMGISASHLPDLQQWQADAYTTGDHAWDNSAGMPLLDDPKYAVIRPANYPVGVPGRGYHIFSKGAWTVAVINIQGQVFMKNDPLNPFLYIDELLDKSEIKAASLVLVDFHAEASSEKRAMGWHLDGRVTAVWGTHTHIPTHDAQVLPQGTGYVSDVGMNGGLHSIIGFAAAGPLKGFRQQTPYRREPASGGPLEVNAILIEADGATHRASQVTSIRRILNETK